MCDVPIRTATRDIARAAKIVARADLDGSGTSAIGAVTVRRWSAGSKHRHEIVWWWRPNFNESKNKVATIEVALAHCVSAPPADLVARLQAWHDAELGAGC